MIDLDDAKRIALETVPETKLLSITELNEGWIFGYGDLEGNPLDITPLFVSKSSGKTKDFFPPDHMEELKNAKKIIAYT